MGKGLRRKRGAINALNKELGRGKDLREERGGGRSSGGKGEDLGEKDLGGKAQQGKSGKDLGRKREKLSGGGRP